MDLPLNNVDVIRNNASASMQKKNDSNYTSNVQENSTKMKNVSEHMENKSYNDLH
jgi:hypothetical protein